MNKKLRVGIVGLTLITLFGIGVIVLKETNYSRKVDAAANELASNEKKLKELQTQISSVYMDDSKQFLKIEVDQEKINRLIEQLATYEKSNKNADQLLAALRKNDQKKYQMNLNNTSEIKKEIQIIQRKLNGKNAVNGLFQSEYLIGSEGNQDVVIIDDLIGEQLKAVKEIYYLEELDLKEKNHNYDKMMNQGIELAENQLKQIEKAQKLIHELFVDGKTTNEVSREKFELVKQAVEEIKNKKAKKSFNEPLKAIEEKVTEIEKSQAEAERILAEEAQQQQEESIPKQEQAVNSNVNESEQPVEEFPTIEAPFVQPEQPVIPPASGNNGGSNSSNGSSNNSSSGNSGVGNSTSNNNNGGGENNNSNNGGNSTSPTKPQPEKPYALNPYTGSGIYYATYEAAVAAARNNLEANGYNIVTEYWSNGAEKYYLEFY